MSRMYFMGKDETHQCTTQKEGDWVTFRCPKCPDYVRRMNIKTGEMTPVNSKSPYKHTGMHLPVGIQPEIYNPN